MALVPGASFRAGGDRRPERRTLPGEPRQATESPRLQLRLWGTSDSHVLALLVLVGLVAFVIVGAAEVILLRRPGIQQASRDAREATEVVGHAVVEPVLSDAIVNGEPEALAVLDEVVRRHLLTSAIVRVKIWTGDGRIVYSDEPALIGSAFPRGDDERASLSVGEASAKLTDLKAPENRFEASFGSLLEVYMGVRTIEGQPLLFEVYYPAEQVDDTAVRVLRSFLPAILGGAVLLELAQLPLAWSLGRRFLRSRLAVVHSALEASDRERRHLAGVLHDGAVQELTGLSYSLDAKAEQFDREAPPEVISALREAADDMRTSVLQLRSIAVAIYPPNLTQSNLASMLKDLGAPLTAQGIVARVDVPADLELQPEIEALLFRAAREVLANVVHHAAARSASLRIGIEGHAVVMTADDDGRGFSQDEFEARQADHHIGLKLVADLVVRAGGVFDIVSSPGRGTRIRLTVPVA